MLKIAFKNNFAKQLQEWYQKHHRPLPWRKTKNPYKIWLSEIILQQTKVIQGIPYYNRFLSAYPNLKNLAAADEAQILRLWQGLGYYTRARNLHACAKKINTHFHGQFPNNYADLLKLPGIGPYTAAAIASIAFQQAVPVVDGNVYRVLSRIFGIQQPINHSAGQKVFLEYATYLMDHHTPQLYNQAIMEFGALQCLPKNPACPTCIFQKQCFAFQHNQQNLLPNKIPKKSKKSRFFHYIIFKNKDKIWMKKRKNKDIWAEMYDFFLIETQQQQEIELPSPLLKLGLIPQKSKLKLYKHSLTHQNIYTTFSTIMLSETLSPDLQLLFQQHHLESFSTAETKLLPKPILICNFLEEFIYITEDNTLFNF